MFIPERCPRCHRADGWHEVFRLFAASVPLGEDIRFRLSGVRNGWGNEKMKKYRCDYCGYENEYNDRPEMLTR